jgi:hypothetical protein
MSSGELAFTGLRLVAVGHVTNDQLAHGRCPGGSALYAGLVGAKLGATVRIVTSFGADFTGVGVLSRAGVQVDASPSEHTTTFQEIAIGGKRGWRALSKASQLRGPVPQGDVLFACPVLAEVDPSCLHGPPAPLVAAGLQGWLRVLGPDGLVEPREPPELGFLNGCKAVFCSDEDLAQNASRVLPMLLRLAEIVVLTEGFRGALIYVDQYPHRVHALPTKRVRDPTGAGDAFAASFLLALASGMSPLDAAVVGACASSIVIEGYGPEGTEGLTNLKERLAWYRSHVPYPSPADDVARPVR